MTKPSNSTPCSLIIQFCTSLSLLVTGDEFFRRALPHFRAQHCYNCLHCPMPQKALSAPLFRLCFDYTARLLLRTHDVQCSLFAHTPRSLSPFPLWGFSDRQWAPRVTQLSNTTYMTVLVLSTTSFYTTNSVNYPTQLPRYKGIECTSIYMVDRGHTMDRRLARKNHSAALDWPHFKNSS